MGAAIYARSSSNDPESLLEQIRACWRYASNAGDGITAAFFNESELIKSLANDSSNIQKLYVYSPYRVKKNSNEYLEAFEQIAQTGIPIKFVTSKAGIEFEQNEETEGQNRSR